MGTQLIVLENATKVEKKPIEFHKFLDNYLELIDTNPNMTDVSDWEFVELVCLDYKGKGYDLMFAYDKNRNSGQQCLFLGKWNDGVI